MLRICTVWLTGLPFLWLAFVVECTRSEEPLLKLSVHADFGEDLGQSFGSLFEARDGKGRLVAGAGFADVYNTRFRSDRHTLQFFVQPETNASNDVPKKLDLQRLPHPDLDLGVYLFDHNQSLYAWSSIRGNSVRRWDARSQSWSDPAPLPKTGLRDGDGVMRLGEGLLTFADNQAFYADRHDSANRTAVLLPPKQGVYHHFYYAGGRLFFYHTVRTVGGKPANEKANGNPADKSFTKIYACPWTPNSKQPIKVSTAKALAAKYPRATPFAWGQYHGKVLTVSNYGGVYVFDGAEWSTLLKADDQVSYQVYSIINFHDRLLFAQYPSGNLIEYDGASLKLLKDWPPRIPGVSPSAREAQSLAIYRGDLYVGVWPWAELWRYQRDGNQWHSLGRMFTHPKTTDKTVHPYEAEAKQHNVVGNHFGQRITSMTPIGPSLMLGASSKGTSTWHDKYDFLSESQRREYGAVLQLTLNGNLAAQMKWSDKPTHLEFLVYRDRLAIRQDGKLLAQTKVAIAYPARLKTEKLEIHLGTGPFGSFDGKLTRE